MELFINGCETTLLLLLFLFRLLLYGLERARRRPSPSIIVLAINASEICAYQINQKNKKYLFRGARINRTSNDCRSGRGSEKLIGENGRKNRNEPMLNKT